MRPIPFLALVVPCVLGAQRPDPQLALLDRMTGHWVLRGTIGGRQTTHDVDVQWILNKEYVQIHETQRDAPGNGARAYEALIYLEWDAGKAAYAVLWLDNTAPYAFGSGAIGRGPAAGDRIALVFPDPNGNDHTTFAYDRANDRWTWTIDTERKDGTLAPFARVALTRK